MAISRPISDSERSIQHDPDRDWPTSLGIHARWPNGMVSYIPITADQFFGQGEFGAPLTGDAMLGMVRNLLGSGEPPLDLPIRKMINAKRKKASRRSR